LASKPTAPICLVHAGSQCPRLPSNVQSALRGAHPGPNLRHKVQAFGVRTNSPDTLVAIANHHRLQDTRCQTPSSVYPATAAPGSWPRYSYAWVLTRDMRHSTGCRLYENATRRISSKGVCSATPSQPAWAASAGHTRNRSSVAMTFTPNMSW